MLLFPFVEGQYLVVSWWKKLQLDFTWFIPFSSSFEFAFSIARVALKSKLPELHLKCALYLEDEVC